MKAKSLMVLGTASGVGKSLITAGFCRLLSDWGYRVAPFKAQNMSNNSYVTDEGGEIGRAQAVQAECARTRPHVDMNPILLKPAADDSSQVVIHGKAVGHFKARAYYEKREMIKCAIYESYNRLASQYDFIVLEGAGSPAEINLKKNDLVNMCMAEYAEATCVLVGDIDRGGVFASLLGTLDLLEPHECDRISGFIINKFRGDQSLLADGLDFLKARSGKKVWGVLPYDRQLWIEEEDAVSIENAGRFRAFGNEELDIAVILLPRLSNFTDFDALRLEPGVRLRYVKRVEDLGRPDLLILPGTKATVADLKYLVENGFREKILYFSEGGGRIIGICGGYQMMGAYIRDPEGIESSEGEVKGLSLFNMGTEFSSEKVLRRDTVSVEINLFGQRVKGQIQGYEIHMGKTIHHEPYEALGRGGAVHPSGRWAGTYFHGLWDNTELRTSFLDALARDVGKKRAPSVSSQTVQQLKEFHYTRLRDLLAGHLNLDLLRECLSLPLVSR